MIYGAIEAGGTKFVLAVGTEDGKLLDKKIISTRGPEETMAEVFDYFKDKEICSLGLGCFGPLDLNPQSYKYGYITTSPKIKWNNYNILGALRENLNIPVVINTDVGAAAYGELTFGRYKSSNTLLYITVGTGIGGGFVVDKKIHTGMMHPEIGHILIRQNPADTYEGNCTYHKNCLEGLASGPAIEGRRKVSGRDIRDDDPLWFYIADYIAQALVNYILIISPDKIVIGGGVMDRKFLYPLIRENVVKILNGYIDTKKINNIENYIVEPSLGSESGILGALALAIDYYNQS